MKDKHRSSTIEGPFAELYGAPYIQHGFILLRWKAQWIYCAKVQTEEVWFDIEQ